MVTLRRNKKLEKARVAQVLGQRETFKGGRHRSGAK